MLYRGGVASEEICQLTDAIASLYKHAVFNMGYILLAVENYVSTAATYSVIFSDIFLVILQSKYADFHLSFPHVLSFTLPNASPVLSPCPERHPL